MAKKKATSPASIYQLKITLRGLKPPIWRRIEVPDNTRLDDLHLMIQAAMGWDNYHLHGFTIGEDLYSIIFDDFGMDCEDESAYRLCDLVREPKAKFRYTYDFGDSWEHDVVVEKIVPPEAGAKYPRCTAGARACPPEDVGSTWGYVEFLEIIADPNHEEHEERLEWIGGEFDPEAFDVQKADALVKKFKRLRPDMG